MIHFFRRIRQGLLSQNKFSKYLFYAIGEIVLVVVGILIALSINNWNEDRKQTSKANEYRQKIINDIIEDTLNINKRFKDCRITKQGIDAYFNYFEQGGKNVQSLLDSARRTPIKYFRYFPINFTFLDMQSSGNLNLLNEQERRALMELYNQQQFIPIVIEKGISEQFSIIGKRNEILDADISTVNFHKIINSSISNENLERALHLQHNYLSSNYGLQDDFLGMGTDLKELSSDAIILLQIGLNKN